MRYFLLFLLIVQALPGAALAGEMRLAARETVMLEYPGASAAFAVDTDIVEVTAIGGQVVLVGRRVGQTVVTVVMPATVETLLVRVEAAPALFMAFESSASRSGGTWEGRYDSGTRRFSTGLTMAVAAGERTARLRLYGIHERPEGGDNDTLALPSASLEIEEPGRRVVLLDELVQASPLTLDGIVLRGLHLHQGPLEMHAGIASATPWDDLLLPSSGDRAVGLSYRSDLGAVRLVPALLWLPDSDTDVPGVVSFGFERGRDNDPLRLVTELGWSGVPGASFDLSLRGRRGQGWLQGVTRPKDFATLGVARPAGSYLDGAWSERFGERTTADLTLSANRLNLPGRQPESASGRLELRHQTTERWSFTGGVGGSDYRDREAETALLRRGTVSLGTAYDTSKLGIAALYRYQKISGANRGGHGGRITVRGVRGAWKANLFVDAQEQSPTLDMMLRERPDLAHAFAELGFVASTPEEMVRLVRDNAALFAERGVEVGTLNLAPLRLQGGADVKWQGDGVRHPELGLRLVIDDTQDVGGGRRAYLATIFSTWRIFSATELFVGYTRWSTQRDGSPADERSSFEVAVRTSFSAPRFPGGGRPITGRVFRDDRATGMVDAESLPFANIEVVLDGQRRTRTDHDGRFFFSAPGHGEHRVETVLPPEPGAYFTMPSFVTLAAGGEAHFAITFSAARLSGTVRSDAGLPLAGVTLRLEGVSKATTTTDSSGFYRFAAPAGEARVFVVADSIPPGYELGNLSAQLRRLAPGAPAVADFTVRTQHVLAGVVRGAGSKPVTVTALEADRTVSPDGTGRFVLRGLSAGPQTLLVRGPRGEKRQVIEIPVEPGSMTSVELAVP